MQQIILALSKIVNGRSITEMIEMFKYFGKYTRSHYISGISPRISYLYDYSVVTIQESNDPYGVLCFEPQMVYVEEVHQDVNLTIKRTGKVFIRL